MTYYTKLPWLAVGPLAIGQTSVEVARAAEEKVGEVKAAEEKVG